MDLQGGVVRRFLTRVFLHQFWMILLAKPFQDRFVHRQGRLLLVLCSTEGGKL